MKIVQINYSKSRIFNFVTTTIKSIFYLFPFDTPSFSAASEHSHHLTLQQVTQWAYSHATQANLLRMGTQFQNADLKRIEGNFDPRISATLSQGSDRLQTRNGLPTSNHLTVFTGKYERKLPLGTTLRAEWIQNYLEQSQQTLTSNPQRSFESKTTVGMRQQLWRNRFGENDRLLSKIAKIQHMSQNLDLAYNLKDYIFQIAQIFFQAKNLQLQIHAADQRLERQRKLQKIVEIKLRRGTAERKNKLHHNP